MGSTCTLRVFPCLILTSTMKRWISTRLKSDLRSSLDLYKRSKDDELYIASILNNNGPLNSLLSKNVDGLDNTTGLDDIGNVDVGDIDGDVCVSSTKIKAPSISLTKDLIKSSSVKRKHFDPSNPNIELNRSNSDIFNDILNGSKQRLLKRYNDASKSWLLKVDKLINESPVLSDRETTFNDIRKLILSAEVSSENIINPISIGDLVTLKEDSSDLNIIAALPSTLNSHHYTVIGFTGAIHYLDKNSFIYRFPNILPDEFILIIKSFVQLEQKYLNIAPIGAPDSKFSRSFKSLPLSLQNKDYTASKVAEANKSDSEDLGSDYLVAQASSQLLINTDVNTFLIPVKAREVYSKSLTDLSILTFNKTSEFTPKLDKIHQFLQFDENGDLINTPRSISIFDILHYLKNPKLVKSVYEFNQLDEKNHGNLGKFLPENIKSRASTYHITDYLALLIAIKKLSKAWNIGKVGDNLPTCVTIFPRANIENIEATIDYLKFENGAREFAQYYLNKRAGAENIKIPPHYHQIIKMFKDYVVGNVDYDPKGQTLLVSIIRMIESVEKPERPCNYSSEYARARSYDLLQQLENKDIMNPAFWSISSSTPKSEVNTMSELSYEYYDALDKSMTEDDFMKALKHDDGQIASNNSLNDVYKPVDDFYLEDPLAHIRTDFGDTPVYCIDSAEAHEIDDGISLHQENDDYVVSVHIANPTSFIKPDSTLAFIAFNKATTTYFPEGPTTMLPKLIGDVAGLGIDGKSTRTFVVQYKLNKTLMDDIINKSLKSETYTPDPKTFDTLLEQSKNTINVFVSTVKNFPKGFTYENVDKVLGDGLKLKKFIQGTNDDVHFDNLFRLSQVSNLLGKFRETNGIKFKNINTQCKVIRTGIVSDETKLNIEGDSMELVFKGSDLKVSRSSSDSTKSTKLVTEMMIFANKSLANFAFKNKISIIHRTQRFNLNSKVIEEIEEFSNKSSLTADEERKLYQATTTANLSVKPVKHEGLGVNMYAWCTSPLRRFVDMVNHWKVEEFLLKKTNRNEGFLTNKRTLEYGVDHIQAMSLGAKRASVFSNRFWDGILLREYLKLLKEGKVEKPIKFQLLIKSDPKVGDTVAIDMIGFRFKARIDITREFLDCYEKEKIEVGQIFSSDRLQITTIDFIENEVVFEYK